MEASDSEFSRTLETHREAVYRYILSIVHDPTEAEDLTQDALLRAHSKLSTLRDEDKLVPWVYRIATNICYDRFRKASYRDAPQSLDSGGDVGERAAPPEPPDPGPTLDKVMEQKEMSACVRDYMGRISDSYRAAILLHDVEGLTNPEIAAMLGVSLATVKVRLHRARNKLRAVLGEGCTFSYDERGVLICEPKPKETGE